ncbi:hypothetical protein SUGI_1033230 [Cryptomeria japonica]|nr:hypothetical protein SUGI_1033230 [Cryptomeria japonica]
MSMLNLRFERRARKAAETAKEYSENLLKTYKLSEQSMEANNMKTLQRQRDDAISQKENACREKEKIAKQLDEVLRLEAKKINALQRQRDDALSQKEVACREKENIAKQLDEVLRLEAKKINALQRQRDDALSQNEDMPAGKKQRLQNN